MRLLPEYGRFQENSKLPRNASFEVARHAFRREMEIVTRSVSEGEARNTPAIRVPRLRFGLVCASNATRERFYV